VNCLFDETQIGERINLTASYGATCEHCGGGFVAERIPTVYSETRKTIFGLVHVFDVISPFLHECGGIISVIDYPCGGSFYVSMQSSEHITQKADK